MSDPIVIFRGTSGLNTVADPARIPMANDAISDVAELVNMRIDQYNRPSKRVGQTVKSTGKFHSLYCDNGDCFVAKDNATSTSIYKVNNDGSLLEIVSNLALNNHVAFKQFGNTKTYYTNKVQTGIIIDGVSNPWVVGDYYGPTTDRSFSIPTGMNHLEIHSGRMFASVGNVLWWSELSRFDLFDISRALIQFHTNITMIKSVSGGLYISTEQNTYFLIGNNPREFTSMHVANFPAIEWSESIEYVEGGDIGFNPGLCALWVSPEGAILGLPSGQVVNLTKEKIIYPEDVYTGFSCLMGYNFIHGSF